MCLGAIWKDPEDPAEIEREDYGSNSFEKCLNFIMATVIAIFLWIHFLIWHPLSFHYSCYSSSMMDYSVFSIIIKFNYFRSCTQMWKTSGVLI